MSNLYRVTDSVDTIFAEDINQIADAFNGQNDIGSISLFAPISAPSAPTVAINATAGNLNGAYTYKVAHLTGSWKGQVGTGTLNINGNTSGGTVSSSVSPVSQQVNISAIPIGGTGVVARMIYRTKAGGTTYYQLVQLNDNTTTSYTDNIADASLTVVMPVSNTTGTSIDSPVFTTAATLPTATSIGITTSTELGYVHGVTSPIQTQLNAKGVGSVTSVTSANTDIAVATNTSTPVLTLNSANSGANKILKLDGSGNASADILIDGTTNKAYTAAEKTKLAGIATGATANTGTVTSVTSANTDASVATTTTTPVITINTGTGANQLGKRDANGNILNIGNQITALSANTTLTPAQSGIINVTTGSSTITITLPTAVTSQLVYTIKKVDSGVGTVSIATTSSQTIDGVLTKTILVQYGYFRVVSDGSNWQIIDSSNTLSGSGTPIGVISPTIVGQLYTDTNTGIIYTATALTNTSWIIQTPYSSMTQQAIINAAMEIWQQGTSFTNPANNAYTADMWLLNNVNSGTLPTTIVHSQATLTAGELFNSKYAYNINVNGAGSGFGVNDFYGVKQRMEFGTSKLCGNGKKVTVSFYAKSNISGKRISVNVSQSYGTGGSPSAIESCTPTAISIRTLTTSMALYTFTFTTNTLTGKTFGTNNDDYLSVNINIMWGTTTASINFGGGTAETFVGAGDVSFTEVVVNAGDVALPYQPKSFDDELTACQRFYENSYADGAAVGTADGYNEMMGSLVAADTNSLLGSLSFKVRKRVNPVITLRAANVANGSGTINNVRDDSAGGLLSVSGCTFLKSQWGIRRITLASAFVANRTYAFSWEADARL